MSAGHMPEPAAKKADWELRLEGASAFAEEYGGHEGCACRWDEKDTRVATCARHQGWLDVIGEWSERAKSAEAALAAYMSAESPAKSPSISERLAWAQRTKSIADDALNAYQRWGHPRAGETDYQEAIDLRTRLLAGIEGLSTLSLQAAPSEPTESMITEGAHVLSEWLNDNAPIGEGRYREPAKAAYLAMGRLAATPATGSAQ